MTGTSHGAKFYGLLDIVKALRPDDPRCIHHMYVSRGVLGLRLLSGLNLPRYAPPICTC
jgi:hypothetical protein